MPQKCFESIDELAAAFKAEDPPLPQMPPKDHEASWIEVGSGAAASAQQIFVGTEFEWVEGTRGGSKIIPTGDGRRFLYRGQTQRWRPCLAQVWRKGQPSDDQKLNHILSRARIAEFESLLKHHPMMEMARENRIEVDYDALAQHYGIPTLWLDVTSSIETACFFAVSRFEAGEILPCDRGTGTVYRVNWRGFPFEDQMRLFPSISHSPASRPGRQHGFSFALKPGMDFDAQEFVESFEFLHSKAASERIIGSRAAHLLPIDSIADVARTLKSCPGVTMAGIKAALNRDGCPDADIERMSQVWGKALCNGLRLDVYLDEEFALTGAQIEEGLKDAAEARKSFLSKVGFRIVRTRKPDHPGPPPAQHS